MSFTYSHKLGINKPWKVRGAAIVAMALIPFAVLVEYLRQPKSLRDIYWKQQREDIPEAYRDLWGWFKTGEIR